MIGGYLMDHDLPARLEHAVTLLVLGFAVVTLARTAAGLLLAALSAVPGRAGRCCSAAARAVTPVLVRRLLVGGLGLGLTAAPALAHASPSIVSTADRLPELDRSGSPAPVSPSAGSPAEQLGVAPDLDRGQVPAKPPPPSPSPPPPPTSAPVAAYVVAPGDTLWAIAARHLPAGASDASIDREWRRWYRANRAVIGADPDVIEPGQRLTPPGVAPRAS